MVSPEDTTDPLYEPEDFPQYEKKIDTFLRDAFADASVREATCNTVLLREGLAHFIVGRYTREGWRVTWKQGFSTSYFTFYAPRAIRPRRWYLLWLA